MNKLLIKESPLLILPSLAVAIGLNGAIFLQQLHYWLEKVTILHNNQKWVYKTLEEWIKEFPFWSETTLKRVIKILKNQSLLKVEKLAKNRTNYYTLNYQKLALLTGQNDPIKEVILNQSIGHIDPLNQVNMTLSTDQFDPFKQVNVTPSTGQSDLIPIYNENQETTTENTTETTADIKIYKKNSHSKKICWEEVTDTEKNEIRKAIKKIEDLSVLSLEDFEDSLMAKGYEYVNFVTAYKVWIKRGKKDSQKQSSQKDLLNNIPTQFEISKEW